MGEHEFTSWEETARAAAEPKPLRAFRPPKASATHTLRATWRRDVPAAFLWNEEAPERVERTTDGS